MVTTDTHGPRDQVQPAPQFGCGWLNLWVFWLVLTGVGGLAPLGLAAYLESVEAVSRWLPREVQTGIALTSVGAGMGFGQWLLLRRWARKAWQWIVPTVAGQPLGWFAAVAVSWHYDAWVLTWVVSGIGQWLVLRRWVHRSWWWLIAAAFYAPLRLLTDLARSAGIGLGVEHVFTTHVALAGLVIILLLARSAKPEQLKIRARPIAQPPMQPRPILLRALRTTLKVALVLLYVLLYLLLFIGGFFVLFGGLWVNSCTYHDTVEVSSPDGRYVARFRVENCGGVLGDIDSRVTIRDTVRPYLNVPEDRVVLDSLARNLKIRWADARTLVVEYTPQAKYSFDDIGLVCEDRRDITIICQAITAVQQFINPVESILTSMERGETTATIGIPGVFLVLSTDEVDGLGDHWVGPGHIKNYNYNNTAYALASEDGRRVYRSPKVDPNSIRAGHSKTGRQAIFERFSSAEDRWQTVRVEVFDLDQHIERQQALLLALEAAAADTEPTTRLRFGNWFAALTAAEALALGRQWVGGGPSNQATADGTVRLVSADGEREYRGPQRVPEAVADGDTMGLQAVFIAHPAPQGVRREIRVHIASADQSVPSAPSTKLLFIETFDGPEAGKLSPSSPDPARFQAGYVEGEYAIRLTEPGEASLAKVDLPGEYLAASIDVDARLVGETAEAVILVGCRVNPAHHEEFRLVVHPGSGRFRLSRWANGQEERPPKWHHHVEVKLDNESNRIGLYCGRGFSVSFNDVHTIATVYEQIPEGIDRVSFKPEGGIWIGVGTIGETATPVEARFDNLVVQDSQCFRPDDT